MKMKLVSLALLGAMLVSGTAAAMDCDPRFYVGGELQLNHLRANKDFFSLDNGTVSGKTAKKNRVGTDLIAGTRITENFGLEAGYAFLGTAKFKENDSTSMSKVKVRNAHIDAMGYVPVGCDVNLIGSLGVGRMTTKVSYKEDGQNVVLSSAGRQELKQFSKAKTGMRVGLGAEYKIDENLSARLMARHQKGNKVIKNVNSVGLGLFYTF
jgi:outer membrane autotransporter protein